MRVAAAAAAASKRREEGERRTEDDGGQTKDGGRSGGRPDTSNGAAAVEDGEGPGSDVAAAEDGGADRLEASRRRATGRRPATTKARRMHARGCPTTCGRPCRPPPAEARASSSVGGVAVAAVGVAVDAPRRAGAGAWRPPTVDVAAQEADRPRRSPSGWAGS